MASMAQGGPGDRRGAEGDTDPTVSHQLALPPLLHPISPSLAALHLARVRLLLDIPAGPSVGLIGEWWCHQCGGLREGLGGAQRGKKRKAASASKATSGPSERRRKQAECANCGASFKRAKPDRNTLITYPSARIAARRKREQAATAPPAPAPAPEVEVKPAKVPTCSTDRPTFDRVKDTEPNLPTYPPPAPRAGSPDKSSKKRKKKSGLAKLLAENRERAAAQSSGGSWGLG